MEGQKSDFNQAIDFLNRVNICFYNINDAKRTGNALQWFNELTILSDELVDDMNEEQIKKNDVFIDKLNIFFEKTKIVQGKIIGELYQILRNYEKFLRIIYHKKGYKTRYEDEPGMALR